MAPFLYSDEQWHPACAEIREPLPSEDVLREARRTLEETATHYLEGTVLADERRAQRAESRKRLERMQRVASELDGFDNLKREIADDLDAIREAIKRHAGQSNPQRQMLYDQALTIYTETLQQKIIVSHRTNAESSEPYGATISFLDAVLRPILRDGTPGPEGLLKIIKRFEPPHAMLIRVHKVLAAIEVEQKAARAKPK